MALTKKKKIWITVGTVITVIVLALAITLGVLLWPTKYTETDYEELLNFSDYNKNASTTLVNKWKQDSHWKNIDFDKDSALDIVNNAINNTGVATQKISFIVTESDLFGDEGSKLAGLKFKNKSTYLSGYANGLNYTQTISQPQQLKLGGIDGSRLAHNFGYVIRIFNSQKQPGSKGNFQKGAKQDDPVTVPAGAKATWGKLVDTTADYTSDDVATVADESWTRYKRSRTQDGKFQVYDPVTRQWMNTIKLSDGEHIPSGGTMYQIDDSVIDAAASKASIENHGDYYTVKLVYKTGAADSKYKAADGTPLYDSVIDQACRYAAASLAGDLLGVGVLTVDTIRYSALTMTYEIWNSGLLKTMVREETMTANVSALGMYSGHGGTNNIAREVYSYSDKDTVEYINSQYDEAGAKK